MNRRLIVAVAVCLVSVNASAQRTNNLERGVRIRVTQSTGRVLTGSFVARGADSLAIVPDGGTNVFSIASSDVTRVDRSTGMNRVEGAFIKGAVGLGVGVVLGALAGSQMTSKAPAGCFFACTRGQAAAFGAAVAGAGGFVIGTIVGAATGHETWATTEIR